MARRPGGVSLIGCPSADLRTDMRSRRPDPAGSLPGSLDVPSDGHGRTPPCRKFEELDGLATGSQAAVSKGVQALCATVITGAPPKGPGALSNTKTANLHADTIRPGGAHSGMEKRHVNPHQRVCARNEETSTPRPDDPTHDRLLFPAGVCVHVVGRPARVRQFPGLPLRTRHGAVPPSRRLCGTQRCPADSL